MIDFTATHSPGVHYNAVSGSVCFFLDTPFPLACLHKCSFHFCMHVFNWFNVQLITTYSSLPTITPPSAPPPNSSDSSDTNFETTNPTHLKATTAAPTPRDSQDGLHTDLPSENPTFQCYKKAYGLNSTVTTCTARSHGCYETERYVCMYTNPTCI